MVAAATKNWIASAMVLGDGIPEYKSLFWMVAKRLSCSSGWARHMSCVEPRFQSKPFGLMTSQLVNGVPYCHLGACIELREK